MKKRNKLKKKKEVIIALQLTCPRKSDKFRGDSKKGESYTFNKGIAIEKGFLFVNGSLELHIYMSSCVCIFICVYVCVFVELLLYISLPQHVYTKTHTKNTHKLGGMCGLKRRFEMKRGHYLGSQLMFSCGGGGIIIINNKAFFIFILLINFCGLKRYRAFSPFKRLSF